MKRRERERQEVRLKIIDAARVLFTAGGLEGMTMRELARQIEYSATTIYLYFANKEALVREICAADFAIFSPRMIQAERLGDPVERLRGVAAGYVEFGMQYSAQYRAMFMSLGGEVDPRRGLTADATDVRPRDVGEREREPYDFLYSAVFKATAAGVFRTEYRDVALLTQVVWSGLHGIVALEQVRQRHPRVEWRPTPVATEAMLEILIGGLVAAGVSAAS